jgi:hypothetical protein
LNLKDVFDSIPYDLIKSNMVKVGITDVLRKKYWKDMEDIYKNNVERK